MFINNILGRIPIFKRPTQANQGWSNALNVVIILAAALFFGRSIEKWYSASCYLTDAQVWSSLVQEASINCEQSGEKSVSIELLLSTVEMPCDRL